ncbi:Uncharacterised protein [uncultured archaeon]|nr:Uncharacterised protein [uncultured archaeon]
MGPVPNAREKEVMGQLRSGDRAERRKALNAISRFGGPGAVPLLSDVLEGKGTAEEKIAAARAIRGIAYRTGMYHEGISALERAANGDHPPSVQKAARWARERIAGACLIATSPGCVIDRRVIVPQKEKRTPDFLHSLEELNHV